MHEGMGSGFGLPDSHYNFAEIVLRKASEEFDVLLSLIRACDANNHVIGSGPVLTYKPSLVASEY